MNFLDFIEVWWLSVRVPIKAAGITAAFQRTVDQRLNPSCALNLRLGEVEIDLVAWESGEAEFAVLGIENSIHRQHFDDLRNQKDLVAVLSRFSNLLLPSLP